jgi:hypothetical protein
MTQTSVLNAILNRGRTTMRRRLLSCLVVTASLFSITALAHAATKQLMLTNRSGKSISAISFATTATPNQPLATSAALPLASGASAPLTITVPDGACVFDATYTFATGQPAKQPDLDICQLDGLVVE